MDFADIFTGRLISEIPQALSALCDALKDHTSLVELDLSDNAFGGRCADAMVPFLTTNTSLQMFKLTNNGLGVWGGMVVAEAFVENAKRCRELGKESSLRTVVCGRNRLENGSASHWAQAFSEHTGLVDSSITSKWNSDGRDRCDLEGAQSVYAAASTGSTGQHRYEGRNEKYSQCSGSMAGSTRTEFIRLFTGQSGRGSVSDESEFGE